MSRPDPGVRELLDRVSDRLAGRALREVRMFGAIAVMVDDVMAVAVNGDGSLLVRVDRADDAILLQREEASRAEMGKGRSMGVGWIRVDGAALDDHTLELWMHHSLRRLEIGDDLGDRRVQS